jgi:hypothetical protein
MDIGSNASVKTVLRTVPARRSVMGVLGRLRAFPGGQREVLASRQVLYIFLVLLAALAAFAHRVRSDSIFSCPAAEYSADRYLAYCNGANYADYDHGAFAFDLEPSALRFARDADVLFLGNSRLQVAFSSAATAEWFSAASIRRYLLGFGYFEDVVFEQNLLAKIHPKARMYIINLDEFFERRETEPAKAILHDPTARRSYEMKHLWQRIHEPLCKTFRLLCGGEFTIFRSRETGAYDMDESRSKAVPVSYDQAVDQHTVDSSTAIGIDFLKRLARGRCVILTMVPFVGTRMGDAEAMARGLGLKLTVPPVVPGLETFDGSHLTQASAERWSRAFFQVAGPEIRSCLARQGASAQ